MGSVQPRSGYTRQGYTGHEQLESVGLIHMGGRVYDPMLGRFTSADPFVQAPESLQSHNRYSYCLNNPLSLTDPSGYFSLGKIFKKIGNFFSKAAKKIGRWFKQNWRQVVVVVVAIVVACVTYGYGLSLVGGANATFAAKAAVVTASGAASGATRGGLSAALYGGSASDIFKASLRGAVVGGATAALTFGVAHGGVNGDSIFGTSIWADGATIASEAAIGGAGSVAEGGDFLSGAIGSLGGSLGELSEGGFMVRTAIAAAAGGTAAEIGGGSFENGAISAAYTYMFNHAAVDVLDLDRDPTESELRRDTRMFPDAADEVGPAFAGAASQTAGMALDFFPQERLLAAVGRFFRGFGRFFGLGGRTGVGFVDEAVKLTQQQASNLARFNKKLPAGNTGTVVDKLGDGVLFTSKVPGRVPGSSAVYQKSVDAAGNTISYLKTTFDPKGNIIHIKDKLNARVIPHQ